MPEDQDRIKRSVNRTFSLSPGDLLLLAWAAEYLNTSQSDVVRSAIRSFVTSLQAVARS